MPNFEDAPDGTASIIHTANGNFEITENPFTPPLTLEEAFRRHAAALPPPLPAPIRPAPPYPEGITRWPAPPPHPSYADGSAPLTPPPIIVSRSQVEELAAIIEAPRPFPPRRQRPNRRVSSDPDAAIRKDPNAWSLREAVELCKLLEVVLPEAGFHIALTGGLLYKEGRRKDCDLMFYQIRQVEPNYEVLWKYLTVAGVIRSPSYPENGWLVKATYRGKAIDCLFPNAKKAKKAGGIPYPVIPPTSLNTAVGSVAYPVPPPTPPAPPTIREGYIINPAWEAGAPILVRHNDGAPILYRRSPSGPTPYDPAELLAAAAPAPVPAVAQWEEPF